MIICSSVIGRKKLFFFRYISSRLTHHHLSFYTNTFDSLIHVVLLPQLSSVKFETATLAAIDRHSAIGPVLSMCVCCSFCHKFTTNIDTNNKNAYDTQLQLHTAAIVESIRRVSPLNRISSAIYHVYGIVR